jgi:hypothetical protein
MADYEAQGNATIRKWEREEERKKAKAEAAEENFSKTFANLLKQDNVKKALARDAKNATNNPNAHKNLMAQAEHGTSQGLDEGEITGMEERPWED